MIAPSDAAAFSGVTAFEQPLLDVNIQDGAAQVSTKFVDEIAVTWVENG